MSEVYGSVLNGAMCMTRQCWEQGILAQALMECGEEEKLKLVIYDMILRQSRDGRLCNVENTPAVTDSSFCIPAIWITGKKQKNRGYLEAAKRNIQFLLKDAERAKDGTLFHMIHTEEIWADSAAYLPYSLALTGYYKESFIQMEGIARRLYNKESGLYFHIWDEKNHTYLRGVPWGIGNGWILTGLMRMLLIWDERYGEEKKLLHKRFCELLEQMLEFESENHGFHDILDDETTFEESETAAMVAYTIYRGVKEGLVDAALLVRADRIREALHKKITPDGLVMDAAGSPVFDRAGTSVECQAHVLMMEQWAKKISMF